MADMDLREVLAEHLHRNIGAGHTHTYLLFRTEDTRLTEATPQCEVAADAALARLSQPDVLDEFERRVAENAATSAARSARIVLADMLGGES